MEKYSYKWDLKWKTCLLLSTQQILLSTLFSYICQGWKLWLEEVVIGKNSQRFWVHWMWLRKCRCCLYTRGNKIAPSWLITVREPGRFAAKCELRYRKHGYRKDSKTLGFVKKLCQWAYTVPASPEYEITSHLPNRKLATCSVSFSSKPRRVMQALNNQYDQLFLFGARFSDRSRS